MKARRRRLKRNREAQSLESKQFQQKVIPNKKKNYEPAIELASEIAAPSLVLIPKDDVGDVWELCREFIESAATDQDPENLRLLCVNGMGQLWFVWSDGLEAAAITRIDPDGACCLLACGGKDMSRWLGMLDEIELWASQRGCNRMMLAGRKGWIRKLKDYTISRVFLEKRL